MKLVVITGDSRISRIDKIFGENGPKFLDLYASIYGKHGNRILTNIIRKGIKVENFKVNKCLGVGHLGPKNVGKKFDKN